MASSRLASRTSTVGAMSGTLPTILGLCGGRKWMTREGRNGMSRNGAGAPIASGRKKSFGGRTPEGYAPPADLHQAPTLAAFVRWALATSARCANAAPGEARPARALLPIWAGGVPPSSRPRPQGNVAQTAARRDRALGAGDQRPVRERDAWRGPA